MTESLTKYLQSGPVDMEIYKRAFFASPYYITISKLSDGTYIDVNPGFEEFTGLARHAVIGRKATDIQLWESPADRAEFAETVFNHGSVAEYRTHLINKHGQKRVVKVSANIAQATDGEAILVAVALDVTDEVTYFNDLQKHRENLEQMVKERTDELTRLMEQVTQTSRIDALTNLYNRAYFNAMYHEMCEASKVKNESLAVVIFDIDFFKKINDSYGHLGGDVCLQEVAYAISHIQKRQRDMVFRYGGEEFIFLLPDTNRQGGLAFAERVRKTVAEHGIKFEDKEFSVTVSVGVHADVAPQDQTLVLINKADKALYQAKAAGRNRVCYTE